jgi:hypothetical protein
MEILIFFRKLGLVIEKLIVKGRTSILNGYQIINSSQEGMKLNELKNVLLIHYC